MFGIKKAKEKKMKPLSKKDVLEKLEISSFKDMTQEKLPEFTSLIPNMETEVARTALQQFPSFAKFAGEVVSCYKEIMSQSLKANKDSTKSFMESCDSVIVALNSLLEQKLKYKQKQEIISHVMEILKMKQEKDTENKIWLGKLIKTVSVSAVSIIAIAGSIIGLNLKK